LRLARGYARCPKYDCLFSAKLFNVNQPLVSILIRSTDRKTLEQTLSSVALQIYDFIEVWVIAATPEHKDLPKSVGRFPLHFAPTTLALSRTQAANKALDSAQGRFALFLDDDDWIAPEHVQQLVLALQANAGFKAAYSQAQLVDINGADLQRELMGKPYVKSHLICFNLFVLHTVLFDVSLRQAGCRFDEALDIFEDWDFWLQVSKHTDFFFVQQPTAFYRIHDSSGVHQQEAFTGDAYQKIYRKWLTHWRPEDIAQLMLRNWTEITKSAALQDTQVELAQTRFQYETVSAELQEKLAELEEFTEIKNGNAVKIQSLENTISLMQNSRSWRWTRGIRSIGHLARKVRQITRQQGGLKLALIKSVKVLFQSGPKGLANAVQRASEQSFTYAQWIAQNEPANASYAGLKVSALTWHTQPLVSIIMPTYNSPLNFLAQAIDSVKAQVYPHWQLCIADDASSDKRVQAFLEDAATKDSRISVVLRAQNGHISESSNSALAIAKGEWVALLDHDDLLHPMALYELVKCLQQQPQANIVFSDEDKVDEQGARFGPYFKTDYNPELMWAQNMISHLGCYRKSVLDEVGGFRKGFEGSQDYDLALRVIQRSSASQIVHIPKVLYHWRAISGSTALAPSEKPYAEIASRKALQEHLAAIQVPAWVGASPEVASMNRVKPQLVEPAPLVSILIPTKDRIDLLRQCIDSIQTKSSYQNFEILVINNNSGQAESFDYFAQLKTLGVKMLDYPKPFNFSAINNFAAQHAAGEYLCLMNNDIEIQTPDWMEEMLSFAQLPNAGAVGARLWYPGSGGLQHGGVIVGLGGVAGHAYVGLAKTEKGYFGRPVLHHRCSAVTAACLMIKKSTYFAVNGMDEGLAVAFNDVDFCLRLGQAGFHCVYTPHAEMTHHESASRGDDLSDANRERFMSEEAFMKSRWGQQLLVDPYYSPNLSLDHSDFRMSTRSRVV
jgi:glycosyltransferase involved in cell wall biosynthesis